MSKLFSYTLDSSRFFCTKAVRLAPHWLIVATSLEPRSLSIDAVSIKYPLNPTGLPAVIFGLKRKDRGSNEWTRVLSKDAFPWVTSFAVET